MIEKLRALQGKIDVEKIISYATLIDGDEIIDYILFYYSDNVEFALAVSSSAEGIVFKEHGTILKDISRTAISYTTNNQLSENQLFRQLILKYSDTDEISSVEVILQNSHLTVGLGVDCLIFEFSE